MSGNLVRVLGWIALWALLFWVSRANHPTAVLNAAATTLMILAAAGASAVIAKTTKLMSPAAKTCIAILCIMAAGVLAALAIHVLYDIEIGPDPRRFGLAANIGMDTAVVAVLAGLAGALDWSVRRLGFKSQS